MEYVTIRKEISQNSDKHKQCERAVQREVKLLNINFAFVVEKFSDI